MYGIIYCAQNKISKKIYIGQTVKTLEKRIEQHLKDMKRRKSYFYSALLLYGKDGFVWNKIDVANTKKELNDKEQYWIRYYQSSNKEQGYNLTIGGDGGPQTDLEVLERMRKASSGRHPSEETRKLLSERGKKSKIGKLNPMYGKIPWNKGKKLGPISNKHKELLSTLFTGKKRSKEIGEKISKALKGRVLSKEHKNKIRMIRLGTKASIETKNKMSKSNTSKKAIKCVETNIVYESVCEANRLTGIGKESIRQCCKGKQKTAGKFNWKYI
jgi:group I intron endonuclease